MKTATNGTGARKKKSKSAKPHRPRSAGEDDVEMGKRLRVRRVEMKLSQAELGTKLGVSFQQIQKYEKGVNRIGANRLSDIAKALDVPIDFFFGDGNPKQMEIESLMFTDSKYCLRLLRAYNAIGDQATQHHFVVLMESVSGVREVE